MYRRQRQHQGGRLLRVPSKILFKIQISIFELAEGVRRLYVTVRRLLCSVYLMCCQDFPNPSSWTIQTTVYLIHGDKRLDQCVSNSFCRLPFARSGQSYDTLHHTSVWMDEDWHFPDMPRSAQCAWIRAQSFLRQTTWKLVPNKANFEFDLGCFIMLFSYQKMVFLPIVSPKHVMSIDCR